MTSELEELLPEADREFLERYPGPTRVFRCAAGVGVVFEAFGFPEAYQPTQSDLLLLLPNGYTNTAPDMFWTYPNVMRKDGAWPEASTVHEQYEDRQYQRWSRHFQGGWRPGVDNLQTYLRTVTTEIRKGR